MTGVFAMVTGIVFVTVPVVISAVTTTLKALLQFPEKL